MWFRHEHLYCNWASPNDHFTNTSMSFIRKLLFSILIIPPSHVIFVCWKCMKLARSSVLHFDPTNNDFLLFSTYELSSFSINVEFVYNMVDSCSYILCCQCWIIHPLYISSHLATLLCPGINWAPTALSGTFKYGREQSTGLNFSTLCSSSDSILLAEIFPFEISSGVPQLPMPFVIAEPEVIGGIILGISILYIATRLGSLNIFCSVPIFPT